MSHFCEGALFSHCYTVILIEYKNVASPWQREMYKIKIQNRNASMTRILLMTNQEPMCCKNSVLGVRRDDGEDELDVLTQLRT